MIRSKQFHRQEELVDYLIDLLEESDQLPWLEPHHIVVPSLDYAHWLKTRIGLKSSSQIAANMAFYQPAEFIDDWSSRLLDVDDGQPEWTKSNLQWALFRLLPGLQHEPKLENLPRIDDSANRQSFKWYRLAGHLADTYDKYMIYRPEWISRWRESNESLPDDLPEGLEWQAELWYRLCQAYPRFTDRARRSLQARQTIEDSREMDVFPRRLFVVGLSSLPEASIKWFAALKELDDLEMNVLEWDPLERREKSAELTTESGPDASSVRRAQATRQQWDRQRREWRSLTEQYWSEKERMGKPVNNSDADAAESANLHMLQRVLQQPKQAVGVSVGAQTEASSRNIIFDPSESPSTLQIHSAHGPLREVEVLYEKLLECFDRYESLKPDDILIVSPDMETYAPHINAVFDEPGDRNLRIPFHRFHSGRQSRYRLTELLIELLKAARGRFKVTEILDILDHPAIRSTIGLNLQDVERVEEWLLDLNVRWGYDAEHRKDILRQSADEAHQTTFEIHEQNSWLWAMDRLWLGLSMRSDKEQLVFERLPYAAVEGSDDSRRLGGLQRLLHQLWSLHQFVQSPHSLAEWKKRLSGLIRDWFTVEREQEPDLRWLMEEITDMDDFEEQAESQLLTKLPCDIILEMLDQHILQQRHPVVRMAGRAVVSPMVPLRGIPFKIVAMLGLNQDTFPGSEPTNPFDATTEKPRKGDRSRRREDRQLMMDYIMSARKTLFITYTGRDQRNDESRPPSPLVTELLDILSDGDKERRGEWTSFHPLHGFEARSSQPYSYLHSRVAQSKWAFGEEPRGEKQVARLAGFDDTVNWDHWTTDQQAVSLTIQSLQRFYRHPIRYFCEQTLKIRLREEDQVDTDEEPFDLTGLNRYQLYEMTLNAMLKDPSWDPDVRLYREQGILPHGMTGQTVWREAKTELEQQREAILRQVSASNIDDSLTLDFELTVDDHTVQIRGESGLQAGEVQLMTKTGGSVKPNDRLRTWIAHLACNAAGHQIQTQLWGKQSNSKSFKIQEHFTELSEETSRDYLKRLTKGLMIGGSRPLAFLPKSSYEWATAFFEAEEDSENRRFGRPLTKAADAYYDEHAYHAYRNENDDPYYRYFFHELNPYKYYAEGGAEEQRETGKLIETAELIWKPVWEVRQ